MEREPLWGNDLRAGPLGLSSWKALQVAEQRQKRGVGWSGGDWKGVWPCSYPITTGGLELSLPFSEPHSFQL